VTTRERIDLTKLVIAALADKHKVDPLEMAARVIVSLEQKR
jgi:hypothetical protein